MKGLRTVLTPFAPDQSGAVSVLYEMGGLVVILDAGGCTGNICGFDEPRWMKSKSAVMSAGLRDMDAILGRDKLLVEKTKKAATWINPKFITIIGTPVPAVIGTDMKGLAKLIKKEVGEETEVFSVETFGMKYYDLGAEKAYKELINTYCNPEEKNTDKKSIGIWGATPLDTNLTESDEIKEYLKEGDVVVIGMEGGVDAIKNAPKYRKNIAMSVSGIKAVRLLNEYYGTEYEIYNPLAEKYETDIANALKIIHGRGKNSINVLVVNEQVFATSLRSIIESKSKDFGIESKVVVASYFNMDSEIKRDEDKRFSEEDDFTEEVKNLKPDIIICDPLFKELLDRDYLEGEDAGVFIDTVHFAVSGTWESRKFIGNKNNDL